MPLCPASLLGSVCLCLLLLGDFRRAGFLLLLAVLCEALHVLRLVRLALLHALADRLLEEAAALQHQRRDEALDLGCLLLLPRLAAHDELTHVVLLLKVEERPDVRGALGAETTRPLLVGEARDL